MKNPLHFFTTGPDIPLLQDQGLIDRLFRKKRFFVMVAITLGYGFAYTCRLALSVIKKPVIDSGLFSAEQLGMIGSAFFYTYAFGRLTN
ncbi:MFS transporter, partial [candidate division KSB1 bacterium]|nr:MFS transporter [candidate division KSB1 bacterium]